MWTDCFTWDLINAEQGTERKDYGVRFAEYPPVKPFQKGACFFHNPSSAGNPQPSDLFNFISLKDFQMNSAVDYFCLI